MNNKKTGTAFERETCEKLNGAGYWVHFITPDQATGKQPFDIIAVKNGEAFAIDCKTSVSRIFRLGRAEENQLLAFDKWLRNGNTNAWFLVKFEGMAYVVPFEKIRDEGKVDLVEDKEIEVLFRCGS